MKRHRHIDTVVKSIVPARMAEHKLYIKTVKCTYVSFLRQYLESALNNKMYD